ncbi:trypsin inhibitor [Ditylenchus destructor]|uniref:Trypsin inhibitor n=1 Tax=Ditylenchus destructor TaxID=166010 RepID=A0AAD4NJG8_9BILA|nr:trypsin inhibitor [Ditylenchus destructor]
MKALSRLRPIFAALSLILLDTFYIVVNADKSQLDCQLNEVYIPCGSCEGSCKTPLIIDCKPDCRPARCECEAKNGYVRAHDGTCIHVSECATYRGVYYASGGAMVSSFFKAPISPGEFSRLSASGQGLQLQPSLPNNTALVSNTRSSGGLQKSRSNSINSPPSVAPLIDPSSFAADVPKGSTGSQQQSNTDPSLLAAAGEQVNVDGGIGGLNSSPNTETSKPWNPGSSSLGAGGPRQNLQGNSLPEDAQQKNSVANSWALAQNENSLPTTSSDQSQSTLPIGNSASSSPVGTNGRSSNKKPQMQVPPSAEESELSDPETGSSPGYGPNSFPITPDSTSGGMKLYQNRPQSQASSQSPPISTRSQAYAAKSDSQAQFSPQQFSSQNGLTPIDFATVSCTTRPCGQSKANAASQNKGSNIKGYQPYLYAYMNKPAGYNPMAMIANAAPPATFTPNQPTVQNQGEIQQSSAGNEASSPLESMQQQIQPKIGSQNRRGLGGARSNSINSPPSVAPLIDPSSFAADVPKGSTGSQQQSNADPSLLAAAGEQVNVDDGIGGLNSSPNTESSKSWNPGSSSLGAVGPRQNLQGNSLPEDAQQKNSVANSWALAQNENSLPTTSSDQSQSTLPIGNSASSSPAGTNGRISNKKPQMQVPPSAEESELSDPETGSSPGYGPNSFPTTPDSTSGGTKLYQNRPQSQASSQSPPISTRSQAYAAKSDSQAQFLPQQFSSQNGLTPIDFATVSCTTRPCGQSKANAASQNKGSNIKGYQPYLYAYMNKPAGYNPMAMIANAAPPATFNPNQPTVQNQGEIQQSSAGNEASSPLESMQQQIQPKIGSQNRRGLGGARSAEINTRQTSSSIGLNTQGTGPEIPLLPSNFRIYHI